MSKSSYVNVISRESLISMPGSILNKIVLIKNTDYNRNRRYSSNTKTIWKSLHDGPLAMSYSDIAEAWGAGYNTVRVALDDEYADRIKKLKVNSNKTYYSTHKRKTSYEYTKSLIARKRDLVSSEALSHLKTL